MTDEQYVQHIGAMYNEILSLRKDSDYIVNQPQMDKLVALLEFFLDAAKEMDGKVNPLRLKPKEQHSGVTATFVVFDLYSDKVVRFCDVIKECSAVTMHATLSNEVRISCTIPNVFVHKSKLST